MTPQERQLVDDLFDRLSRVEGAPRDPDALAAIADGQRRAPNALYALVQTVLLQDEALKRAHERIEELEHAPAPAQAQPGGFLDSMRDAVFGQGQSRGSVPSVRPGATERPAWNTGQVLSPGTAPYGQQPGGYGQQPGYQQPAPYGQQGAPQAPAAGGGGSFLGTAAAAAAGMVGGSLLLGSIRNMMGGSGSGADKQAFGDNASASGNESRSPWSSDTSGGNLSKDAGVNDIASANDRGNDSSGSGLYDQASYNGDDEDPDSYGDDDFNDDSDFA